MKKTKKFVRKLRRNPFPALVFVVVFAGLGGLALWWGFADTPTPISTFHISGNQLLDASNNAVTLHGVVRAGTEYMCSEGYGIFDGPTGANEFEPMTKWNINTVFMGLNEDCWLGINGSGINNWAADSGTNYINAIKAEVTSAESYGIHPVIGFFWGDPGAIVSTGNDPNGGGQPPLPDNDHAPLFWEELADTFKNDPNVIFRLQEEPHPGNVGTNLATWQCWSQGDVQYGTGSVNAYGVAPTPVSSNAHCNEKDTQNKGTYKTVGMQSLINIIRGTGANNIIQVPGVAYANMLACSSTGSPSSCGFLDSADGVKLSDPTSSSYGSQLMADLDMYPDSGQICDTTSCYSSTIAPVMAVMPVDLGEIGPNGSTDTQAKALLDWMDAQTPKGSYYAWAWDTWTNLISGYGSTSSAATAASPWGTDYYSRLAGSGGGGGGGGGGPTTQPTDGITFRQTVAAKCVGGAPAGTSGTLSLPQAVSAGDDLVVVIGGQGWQAAAPVVTGVSDNVNGAWTKLTNSGSQHLDSNFYESYSAYVLQNSKAAAGGLTITVSSNPGQSGQSVVALDLGGVGSMTAPANYFQSAPQTWNTTFSSPAISASANDLVLGLYGSFSHSVDAYSAPANWNTSSSLWTTDDNCASAAADWTQTGAAGPVTASIINSASEYNYGGAIELHPGGGGSGAIVGDLNNDGHVNIFDLSIFLSHWQQSGAGLPEDFNSDGVVNIFDLSIFLSHYGS